MDEGGPQACRAVAGAGCVEGLVTSGRAFMDVTITAAAIAVIGTLLGSIISSRLQGRAA